MSVDRTRAADGGRRPARSLVGSGGRREVPLPAAWKARLREWPPSQAVWAWCRRGQVHREYTRRRDYYAGVAAARGLVYREAEVVAAVRNRLRARGYAPPTRQMGEVHTFACVPLYSWHHHLLPDLRELGPVTHFDYSALGFGVEELARADRRAIVRRQAMIERILPALREAHRHRPVDWVFCYGGGQDTSPGVIATIAEELGLPTVNMSLDDKQGWAGRRVGECRTGAADLTASFDLFLTSARVACEWHLVEGGRPLYRPPGFDAATFRPRDVMRDIAVSFVGVAYGFRRTVIRFLRRHGVSVQTFGAGWPGGSFAPDTVGVFSRSRINLGMGGIEYSESLTNVKGRDFEVPGTGGGVYLTSYNPDLAQHFEVGREILCYGDRNEMLELIRHYLAHTDEAEAIARRGRERSVREHRWLHRYLDVLRILGILVDGASTGQA